MYLLGNKTLKNVSTILFVAHFFFSKIFDEVAALAENGKFRESKMYKKVIE